MAFVTRWAPASLQNSERVQTGFLHVKSQAGDATCEPVNIRVFLPTHNVTHAITGDMVGLVPREAVHWFSLLVKHLHGHISDLRALGVDQ